MSTSSGCYKYTGEAGRVVVCHVHPLLRITLRLYRKHTVTLIGEGETFHIIPLCFADDEKPMCKCWISFEFLIFCPCLNSTLYLK